MKKIVASLIVFGWLTFCSYSQSIIHVNGKTSVDIEAIGSVKGYGAFLGQSYYFNHKLFIQYGIHYEDAQLDATSNDYEILVPINFNYSIMSMRTFYLNIRGGVFGGMELVRSDLTTQQINNFTYGFVFGPNIEYWLNARLAFVAGVDQYYKFHTVVGQKIVANIGIKLSLN